MSLLVVCGEATRPLFSTACGQQGRAWCCYLQIQLSLRATPVKPGIPLCTAGLCLYGNVVGASDCHRLLTSWTKNWAGHRSRSESIDLLAKTCFSGWKGGSRPVRGELTLWRSQVSESLYLFFTGTGAQFTPVRGRSLPLGGGLLGGVSVSTFEEPLWFPEPICWGVVFLNHSANEIKINGVGVTSFSCSGSSIAHTSPGIA